MYPVVGGAGWAGGYTTHVIASPPSEEEPSDFDGALLLDVSAPLPADNSDPDVATVSEGSLKFIKTFGARMCGLNVCPICPLGVSRSRMRRTTPPPMNAGR